MSPAPGSGAAVAGAGADTAPHFVLVPMMAAGHAGPMIDMARALARRGALVTFVTTPLNLPRLGCGPGDDALLIRFLPLRFPCAEAGLPEGCESLDALPGPGLLGRFNDACAMLRTPLVARLRDDADAAAPPLLRHGGAARDLAVPRLAFDGFCAFSSFCMRQMNAHRIFDGVVDDRRPVRIPAFSIDVEISRARFAELEPRFVDAYEAAMGKKIWAVGPLFLNTMASAAIAEDAAAVRCASWLESKKPRSMVFVSFGSLVRSSVPQLAEIAHGLEASNRPFIWVVKSGNLAEFERWLSGNGFESRVGEMGLRAILSHPATGAFVTHGGWNSVLESTWPHFAEQFVNEKLAVDVLRVGVPVGVKDAAPWGVEAAAVVETREDVARAVAAVMDGGEEGSARRARAAELGRNARDAVARGGSSDQNVSLLMEWAERKKPTA
ncbi:hypothetical protein PVAP13_1NG102900 [Panicum virgatum]|uniref:Glycosyltransferase n=1 Tax=Panicum virgatum TaxID=38727 RepID=A0A8T0WSW0_PANVG|nr:hypothetical protein PVAP13_1NG102900 [Panicum virgatum]